MNTPVRCSVIDSWRRDNPGTLLVAFAMYSAESEREVFPSVGARAYNVTAIVTTTPYFKCFGYYSYS